MALDQRQRPTAALFRDPFAGHRNYYTGEPDGPHDAWTAWDFALGAAIQTIKDGTTEHGNLRWEVEDENADIVLVYETDKEREAIDLATSRENYKSAPGEWLRPTIFHPYWKPESGEPEPFQTRKQWIEKMVQQEEERRAR